MNIFCRKNALALTKFKHLIGFPRYWLLQLWELQPIAVSECYRLEYNIWLKCIIIWRIAAFSVWHWLRKLLIRYIGNCHHMIQLNGKIVLGMYIGRGSSMKYIVDRFKKQVAISKVHGRPANDSIRIRNYWNWWQISQICCFSFLSNAIDRDLIMGWLFSFKEWMSFHSTRIYLWKFMIWSKIFCNSLFFSTKCIAFFTLSKYHRYFLKLNITN